MQTSQLKLSYCHLVFDRLFVPKPQSTCMTWAKIVCREIISTRKCITLTYRKSNLGQRFKISRLHLLSQQEWDANERLQTHRFAKQHACWLQIPLEESTCIEGLLFNSITHSISIVQTLFPFFVCLALLKSQSILSLNHRE